MVTQIFKSRVIFCLDADLRQGCLIQPNGSLWDGCRPAGVLSARMSLHVSDTELLSESLFGGRTLSTERRSVDTDAITCVDRKHE